MIWLDTMAMWPNFDAVKKLILPVRFGSNHKSSSFDLTMGILAQLLDQTRWYAAQAFQKVRLGIKSEHM